MGLSQEQLAEMVGITHQQLHRYEAGTARIAAGRLFKIAQALGTPIDFFFDGLDRVTTGAQAARSRRLLELVRILEGLSADYKRVVLQMSAALAAESGPSLPAPRAGAPDAL
jgi:transcriptional regulator with XRE-family HTH domain